MTNKSPEALIAAFQKAWSDWEAADDVDYAKVGTIGDAGDALCDALERERARNARLVATLKHVDEYIGFCVHAGNKLAEREYIRHALEENGDA